MKFSRDQFFAGVRAFLKQHGKSLTQPRVDAIEFLITSFEGSPAWKDLRHIAYAFATISIETAWTFKPITEYGNKSYFNKYDGRSDLGNNQPGDGYRFRGRGFVQITGRKNYKKFDIDSNPESALQPDIAFRIMTEGMHKGIFTRTGKKLSDYISDTGKDYKNARRIINGLDRAAEIAGYAREFEEILRDSKVSNSAASHPADTSTTNGDPANISVEQMGELAGAPPKIEEKNQQDVTVPAVVAQPEPYLGLGFWGVIKRDLVAATGGNLSLSALSVYAQQASEWPPWIVGIISKLVIGVLIATFGYLVFRVIHYFVDSWKQAQKVKVEAEAATNINKKDIKWV